MSETPNTITGIKRELLMRLGHDADIFALISLCTREPYVVCDEETFDDEVFLFLDEEEAKKEAARLAEKKVPVTVAKINGKDMLVFSSTLKLERLPVIIFPSESFSPKYPVKSLPEEVTIWISPVWRTP